MNKLLLAICLIATQPVHAFDFSTKEMVTEHNRWRTEVGVPPLKYSTSLALSAKKWANHLKVHNHCQMQHSKSDGEYGENLYWGSALIWSNGKRELQRVTPSQVVDAWGNEKKNYDYASNHCKKGKVCGHYTQLVWSGSTTVGCAAAICKDTSEQIWVCQYQPPGNWVGIKPY